MYKELYFINYNGESGYVLLVLNSENKTAYAYQRMTDGSVFEGVANMPYEQIKNQYMSHGININSLPIYGFKA